MRLQQLCVGSAVLALLVFASTASAAQILHYWDFETSYADKVGAADGTAGSEVTTSVGHDGATAATFPGSLAGGGAFTEEGFVDTTGADVIGAYAFTYWFKIADDGTTNPRGLFDFSGNGGDGPQSLYIGNSDTLAFRMDGAGGGGAATYAPEGGLEDDQWHFVAANYDPTTGIELYVDGSTVVGSLDASFGDAVGGWDADQYLGAFNVNYTTQVARGLDGSLDDVAIYSGTLTPAQIQGIYEGSLLPTQVPEPSTALMLLGGLTTLLAVGVRRRA
ncbi:LamG domain-containing protein [Aeoliella mucimassa]|uniref:Ice-binding protein C-terminal domain-containing protein n=1 Tax=Aeoliella mucimassa TaxID=2527972 RepID=A0A518AK19_9BACT|nr:LamG domain-containing protein [Aeoliella mucimassa]QDU55081.1 hypothetical protein Pan181_12670 [Aeoliella mucimassa]